VSLPIPRVEFATSNEINVTFHLDQGVPPIEWIKAQLKRLLEEPRPDCPKCKGKLTRNNGYWFIYLCACSPKSIFSMHEWVQATGVRQKDIEAAELLKKEHG